MNISWRGTSLLGFMIMVSVVGGKVQAQNYPTKPIRLIVGFAAGGAADVQARLLSQKLSDIYGQPMIVDNRTGASGAIATERVATSAPDGYTLLMGTAAETIIPVIRAKLPYDLERDLAAVSLVAMGPYVLAIGPSVLAKDVQELVALARAQPGKLSFGSAGIGSTTQLAGALFGLMANIQLLHVPYKGGSESAAATASGQIAMCFAGITGTLSLINGGKIKALAVSTKTRSSLMPNVPTLHEAGITGYERSAWYGVLAPAKIPTEIRSRLNQGVGKVVNTSEVKELFGKQGLDAHANSSEEFTALIKSELAENRKLAAAIGLKAE